MGVAVNEPKLADRIVITLDHQDGCITADSLWYGQVPRIGWWEWIKGWFRRSKAKSAKPGLRDCIEGHFNTRRTIGPSGGAAQQLISTPFLHYAIMTTAIGEDRHLLKGQIKQYFSKDMGNEAAGEPNFELYEIDEGVSGSRSIKIHFGHGIFIPANGEALAWYVEISHLHEETWNPVRLPDNQYAGLYMGQEAIAFSASSALTAAVIEGGFLSSDEVIFFGRKDEGLPNVLCLTTSRIPQRGAALEIDNSRREVVMSGVGSDAWEQVKQGAPITIRTRRDHTGEEGFRMRFRRADNRYPLLHHRPKGPHLALVGLVLPRLGRSRSFSSREDMAEWWFDLGKNGMLPERPFDPLAFSIAANHRGVRAFRWDTIRNVGTLAPGNRLTIKDGARSFSLRHIPLKSENSPFWGTLIRSDDIPFAYGAIEEAGMALGLFRDGANDQFDAKSDRVSYVIDWLEACGGFIREINGERSYHDYRREYFGNDTVMIRVENGLLQIGKLSPSLPSWLGEIDGDSLQSHHPLPLIPGAEFLLGWYLFRFEAG